jgi:hypothetical protein
MFLYFCPTQHTWNTSPYYISYDTPIFSLAIYLADVILCGPDQGTPTSKKYLLSQKGTLRRGNHPLRSPLLYLSSGRSQGVRSHFNHSKHNFLEQICLKVTNIFFPIDFFCFFGIIMIGFFSFWRFFCLILRQKWPFFSPNVSFWDGRAFFLHIGPLFFFFVPLICCSSFMVIEY